MKPGASTRGRLARFLRTHRRLTATLLRAAESGDFEGVRERQAAQHVYVLAEVDRMRAELTARGAA